MFVVNIHTCQTVNKAIKMILALYHLSLSFFLFFSIIVACLYDESRSKDNYNQQTNESDFIVFIHKKIF